MRVLIVEDEMLLAEELAETLLSFDFNIEIVGKLQSVSEAVAWLHTHTCDLLFLDIHLNDGLSFSIFSKVEVTCPIIFTTAYDQYAIQAFDVNSIAYLLKPIEEEDLKKALKKYKEFVLPGNDDIQKLLNYISNEKSLEKQYKERLMLSMGKKQIPVNVKEIAYFRADDRYVFAMTTDGQEYFCDVTLTRLVEILNPRYFFRINRRFIVNYASVSELNAYSKGRIAVKLSPEVKELIIISANKATEFKQWLGKL